ncbi:DsbA family oxidoreductase [Rhodococcus sp. NPDC047139]|jgi:predicted DsbA family dithiol-disulfide isomerase|uniref:DsbA family oxidoreductase n=1 Tax=Rhodococcus sp. NPDC047139 TaxID=3155141 RepID=UPI0033F2CDB1
MSTPEISAPTAHIEIWSDIACPWCYIGKRRFAEALASFEERDRIEVTWRSYQLSPDTPVGRRVPEVEALAAMKGMPAAQVRQMFGQVSDTAAQVGISIDFDNVIAANTFDAHRLVHLAGDKGDEVLEALFRAHFVEGEVVDDRDVLVKVAGAAGLDPQWVRAALDGDDPAGEASGDAVAADLLAARKIGVQGVPFFVANRAVAVSGAQPTDVFLAFLRRAVDDVTVKL